MFYSGDENHTDQVTSGPIDEDRQHIWDSDDGWCRLHRTYCEF